MTDRKPPTPLHAAAAQWLFSVGSDGQPILGVSVMPAAGDSPMHDVIYKVAAGLLAATQAVQMRDTADAVAKQRMDEQAAMLKTPIEEAQIFITRMRDLMQPGVTLQISASPHGRVTINGVGHGASIFEALDAYIEWKGKRKKG